MAFSKCNVLRSFILIGFLLLQAAWCGSSFTNLLEQELKVLKDFQDTFPSCKELFYGKKRQPQDLQSELSQHLQSQSSPASYLTLFCLGILKEKQEADEANALFLKLDREIQSDIVKNWLLSRISLGMGIPRFVEKYIQRTHRYMLEQGYLRLPELAAFLMQEAARNIRHELYDQARKNLSWAMQFDPYCPWVAVMRIEIQLKENPPWKWNPFVLLKETMKGLKWLQHYDNRALVFLNLFQSIRLSLGIFFAAMILILFCRYFLQAFHNLAEKFPRNIPLGIRNAAVGCVLLGILIIGLGWIEYSLIILSVIWFLLSLREKIMAGVFLICLIGLPVWLYVESGFYQHLDKNSFYARYLEAVQYGWDFQKFKDLSQSTPRNNEQEVLKKISLSIMYRKKGEFEKARLLAQEAFTMDNGNPLVVNNLANSHFILSDFSGARNLYKKVLTTLESSPEVLFNLSQTELYLNDTYNHGIYLKRSIDNSPYYIPEFIRQNDRHFQGNENDRIQSWPLLRRVMDLPLQSSVMWKKPWTYFKSQDHPAKTWKSGLLGIPAAFLPFVGMFLLLLFSAMRKNSALFFLGRTIFMCKLCGRTVCSVCRSGAYCGSCFQKTNQLDNGELRDKLVNSIRNKTEKRKKLVSCLLNMLFPGIGGIFLNPKFRTYLLLLGTATLWAFLFNSGHLVKEYPDIVMGSAKWIFEIPLILLYMYFFFILVHFSIKQITLKAK